MLLPPCVANQLTTWDFRPCSPSISHTVLQRLVAAETDTTYPASFTSVNPGTPWR